MHASRYAALILLPLAAISLCTTAVFGADNERPRISISPAAWDFLRVKEGEKPDHLFTIENAGKAPLTIRRVLHSCGGCFETTLASNRLEPGEKTTLKLVVDTNRRRGTFKKYLYVESNDPQISRKRIVVQGYIEPRADSEQGPTEEEEVHVAELPSEQPLRGPRPVCLTYFDSATCEECRATRKALAKLQRTYATLSVQECEIDDLQNYALMLEMEKRYGAIKHAPPIIYVGTTLLDGWDEVRTGLAPAIHARLEDGTASEWPPEVIRVVVACDPASHQHYPATLFEAHQAHPGTCTAKSTIFTANIAAGLMLEQFTRWLRRLPVDAEVQLNLLATELCTAESARPGEPFNEPVE